GRRRATSVLPSAYATHARSDISPPTGFGSLLGRSSTDEAGLGLACHTVHSTRILLVLRMRTAVPILAGNCEMLAPLARGGMGELYLARKRGLEGFEKLVVLKTIPAGRASQAEVRRIVQEARLGATLDHPNIVQVHDVGVHEGRYFFIMEFVH